MSASSPRLIPIIVLCLAGLLAACTSAPGRIIGASPDTSFVKDPELRYLYSEEESSWLVAGLDGRIHKRLFGTQYRIEDISANGRTFVLEDSDRNLLIARIGDAIEIIEVPGFHGFLGNAALSRDGRLIAATKIPDYSQPQSAWVEDERLYLVDVATLEVRVVGRFEITDGLVPSNLVWLDETRVRIGFTIEFDQVIDIRTGQQSTLSKGQDSVNRWRQAIEANRANCSMDIFLLGGDAGDKGLAIATRRSKDQKEERTPLVKVEGRRRGYHDYMETIWNAAFTKDCRYVTFYFGSGLWVLEIATGKVGPVLPGLTRAFERPYPIGLD